MSLLYKDQKDVIHEVEIAPRKDHESVKMYFSSDCGKFGTFELLDEFELSPKKLLEILQKHFYKRTTKDKPIHKKKF